MLSVSPVGGSEGTTTRRTLAIAYDDNAAELPERVFAKCTPGVAQRLMLGLGGLIHSEPAFYAHVRPHLPIEAPVGYHGAVDGRSWHSVVLLQDVVHTRGAKFWTPPAALSRGETEDLLGSLATWHGVLWESPLLGQWSWLRTPERQMGIIDSLISLADRRRAGVQRAGSAIPARLRPRQADLFEGLRRSMRRASLGPRTYLHGDLHVANTYVTQDGRVGVCDWQVGLQGCWAHDLAYLLATALDTEDRRRWEQDLLALYLDGLGAAGGRAPDRESAWLAYRQALLYPYFAWVYTLGRARLQPAFQPEAVSLTMIERIAAAIDDLDALSAVGL